jgi:hypothetical protein
MINKEDIIWLAGYLEGEGCFTITSADSKGGSKTHRILVTSVDKDVIERASILLVGYIRLTRGRHKHNPKIYYGTNISGVRAIGWMMTLYPLMGERRKARIKEVIEHWKRYNKTYSMTKRAIKTRLDRNNIIKRQSSGSGIPLVNPFVTKNLTSEAS